MSYGPRGEDLPSRSAKRPPIQPSAGRPRPESSGGRPRTERDMLRRTLSQNFLRAEGADQFMNLVDADPESLAIEAGAGEGILTERLAARYARVVAYEVDPHVARKLKARVRRLGNVQVVVDDFLAAPSPEEPFQVAGNVPFSLTSPIVKWCLGAELMTKTTIITQLEYAKKRTGAYGRWSKLTILTWPEFAWELRGQIPRSRFRPVPRVDAGVLSLAKRERSLIAPSRLAAYYRMVELGFTGLGGTLYASLRRAYPTSRVASAFRAAGLDRATVVAFVTPEQWLDLFMSLEPQNASGGLSGTLRGGMHSGRPTGRRTPRSGWR